MNHRILGPIIMLAVASARPLAARAEGHQSLHQAYESLQSAVQAAREQALLKDEADKRRAMAEKHKQENAALRHETARKLLAEKVADAGIENQLRAKAGMSVTTYLAHDGRHMNLDSYYGPVKIDIAGLCDYTIKAEVKVIVRADATIAVRMEQENSSIAAEYASWERFVKLGGLSQLKEVNAKYHSSFGTMDTSSCKNRPSRIWRFF